MNVNETNHLRPDIVAIKENLVSVIERYKFSDVVFRGLTIGARNSIFYKHTLDCIYSFCWHTDYFSDGQKISL